MKISIPCNLKDYFKLVLGVLSPVTKMTRTESELAATIMYLHYINQGKIEEKDLFKRILSPVGRKIMSDTLKISQYSMNMHVVKLKKKGILTKKMELSPQIMRVYPKSGLEHVTYEFKITMDESNQAKK